MRVGGQSFDKRLVEASVVIARKQIKMHGAAAREYIRDLVFGARRREPVVKQIARYDDGVYFVFGSLRRKASECVGQLLPAGNGFVVAQSRELGVEMKVGAMDYFHI